MPWRFKGQALPGGASPQVLYPRGVYPELWEWLPEPRVTLRRRTRPSPGGGRLRHAGSGDGQGRYSMGPVPGAGSGGNGGTGGTGGAGP